MFKCSASLVWKKKQKKRNEKQYFWKKKKSNSSLHCVIYIYIFVWKFMFHGEVRGAGGRNGRCIRRYYLGWYRQRRCQEPIKGCRLCWGNIQDLQKHRGDFSSYDIQIKNPLYCFANACDWVSVPVDCGLFEAFCFSIVPLGWLPYLM